MALGLYSAVLSGTAASVTVTRATHGIGTAGKNYLDMIVQVWDKSSAPSVPCDDIQVNKTVDASNGDVTVTFGTSRTLSAYQITIIGA